MSANLTDKTLQLSQAAAAPVIKRITNAQTVCNEKNEKGKLCNGHLKQLRTAGELSEVHLRGDDVLSKCQTCGVFYMGPPLGHVRDPNKQHRFVEAELTALLQAAGGTLPVIKKNDKGVYVMVEPGAEQSAPAPKAMPTAAKPARTGTEAVGTPDTPPPAAKPATLTPATAANSSAEHKPGAQPNRQLFKRTTYAGVADTGPAPGESFADKVERLRKVAAGAKQRAEDGGGSKVTPDSSADLHRPAADASAETGAASSAGLSPATVTASPTAGAATPADLAASSVAPAATHTGSNPNRSLFRRSTYCGVADTGPVAGESFEQKVERLRGVAAAAKQRADEGGH